MMSCITISCITVRAVTWLEAAVTMPIMVVVSTYAIGSLAPDSNSNNGRKLCLSPIPLVRRIENTDAESVEDIVDAMSSATEMLTLATECNQPNTKYMITPVMTMVSSTPIVASVRPGAMTGRMSDNFVSNPPEKRMIHSAIVPMAWAEPTLSI